ncbi:hypothetical protein FOJ82_09285 [Tessaracoccus rhinocerotis]|uniref:Uncharacterized protein n=1 Tax=Tessaracoccus rhinocerotis TaxID=1689449 RepID=A0A553K0J5_9ACTN|nr:hypothetical protein [Tessaracoccus rhinocerotis]TRY18223.1 hypothetical protein FOJ82_09285 [Tessaracoccus rhinocerotis]
MANASTILKAAGAVVATTVTILGALRDNPQLSDGLNATINKIKTATNSENPKIRFDGKLTAIEACADAVEENFPDASEPDSWRALTKTLRMRGELAWSANDGASRKKAMKALTAEATEVLRQVNEHLVSLAKPPSLSDGGGTQA